MVVTGYNRRQPGVATGGSLTRVPKISQPHYFASAGRDSRGRIARSPAARSAFEREHPSPATGRNRGDCPGYVIDHVKPLECGGVDAPSNMQWQTVAEGKAKDKTERYCR